MSWSWAIRVSSLPFLFLECRHCPSFSHLELFQGCSLERARCCWDYLDCICDCTQLRTLYKLLDSGGKIWRSNLVAAQDKPCKHKSPCLLNLPPTHLEWFAYFLCLSLPSMYGGQFQISPRQFPRLWTNSEKY